ncbi:MAG: hypothetical protein ACE5Q6_26685 [Dehalococcoidia bacterium]
MATSLGITVFGAISNAYDQEEVALEQPQLVAPLVDSAEERDSALHQAFTFVCPFH